MNATTPSARNLLNGWRIAGWGAAAALLALPAIAMQFTREVNWGFGDFFAMGMMLLMAGLGFELAARISQNWAHRAGMAIAVFGGFFTVWSNLAVGILGSEDEAVNFGFFIILMLGILGSILVWFRARPMMAVIGAMAAGQLAMGGIGFARGFDDWPIVFLFFTIWTASALCFREAAQG